MKKSVLRKLVTGVCTATMLLACTTMGVLASSTNLDPSSNTNNAGNTTVNANVEDSTNNPDYIITIPQTVDFGALAQPTTETDVYSTANLTVTCVKADGLTAGQSIAVLVKDQTAAVAGDPFKLVGKDSNNSANSLTYEMYYQSVNIQSGTWYTNGYMFINFTRAGEEHTKELRLNRKQLYGKDLATWGGAYSGTLNFYTKIVSINAG